MVFWSICIYHKNQTKVSIQSSHVSCGWEKTHNYFLLGFVFTLGVVHLRSLTVRPWKLMIGRRSFPFGALPIFRVEPWNFRGVIHVGTFALRAEEMIQFDEGILSIWIGSTTTSEIVFDMGIEVFAISWFPGRNCGTPIWSCLFEP